VVVTGSGERHCLDRRFDNSGITLVLAMNAVVEGKASKGFAPLGMPPFPASNAPLLGGTRSERRLRD